MSAPVNVSLIAASVGRFQGYKACAAPWQSGRCPLRYLSTRSFNSLPTLKKGSFFSPTWMTSPVFGFRPW